MRFLSVCSGIESASVAWEPLGWEASAFSEIEPFPCAVLKHRFPKIPNLGDMRRFKEWPRDPVDLLVGGTPCQSFSVAGLRKGMDDPRGNLALVFLSLARLRRPRWVVWENVPGVLSSAGGRDFGAFLGGLGELGYGWSYRVLDAQHFGVPQRRRRVFVVGYLGDWRRAAAVLFEPESLSGNPPPGRETREGIAPTLDGRSGRSGENSFNTSGGLIAPTIPARNKGGGGMGTDFDLDGGLVCGTLNGSGAGAARPGGQANELDFCIPVSKSLNAHRGRIDGESETFVVGTLNANGKAAGSATQQDAESGLLISHALRADGFDASEDGTGRGTPLIIQDARGMDKGQNGLGISDGKTAYTLDQGGSQAIAFPGSMSATQRATKVGLSPSLTAKNPTAVANAGSLVRRLTPRECERLQGFPDDWMLVPFRGKPAADGPRYKAIGNSKAIPVVRWIGRRIALVDAISPTEK